MSHLPHACDDEDCSLSDGPPQHSLVCTFTRLTEPLLTILHTQTHTSMLVCHIISARYSTPMITSVHSRSDQSVNSGFHTHQRQTTRTCSLNHTHYEGPSKSSRPDLHCESKKLGHFFMTYNFRNIEQIFTKFGTNQSFFILNIVPEFI